MKNRIATLATLTLAVFFANCSDNNNDPITYDPNSALYTGVLTDLSREVITDTYESLNTNALALKAAADAFTIGNDAQLATLKSAWQATRAPWEESEGFLYGPVDTDGIDPAMDTWPVDVNAMNNILSGGDPITAATLEANNETRGFHLIEYLVWGINGNKTAADFTAREVELLRAAAEDLQNNTQTLYDGWKIDGGNYGSNFINAGQSGSVYISQKVALEEIVNGLITIADEVATGKIQAPLDEGATVEESRFSNNSKLDFANNMRSIQNVYEGNFGGNENNGLTNIVALTNPALDTEIKTAITTAISAIEAIPGTFTDALTNNEAAVINAQEKVAALQTTLQTKLLPFISNN
jgi:putative iron-regulated protein